MWPSDAGWLIAIAGVIALAVLAVLLAIPLLIFAAQAVWIFVLVLFTLPFAFFGSALLLSAMLPTTFSRALLVAFIYHFLTVVLVVVVGGTIAGLLSL